MKPPMKPPMTPRMTPRINSQAGHTLLEMMIVLAVLVVLFSVTVPRFTRVYQHEELDAAARTMAVQIRGSQMAAVANQKAADMRFGNFKPGYTMWQDNRYLGAVSFSEGIGYRNGYLSLPISRMQFNPDGTLTDSGVIRLVNPNHEEADIQVEVSTGVVLYGGVYTR